MLSLVLKHLLIRALATAHPSGNSEPHQEVERHQDVFILKTVRMDPVFILKTVRRLIVTFILKITITNQ